MQDDIKKRTVDLQSTVVVNEAKISESVHEEIYSRTGCANQFCQSLLTNVRDHFLGSAFLAEVGQHQKRSRQPLFARIEQLIDQVRLRAIVTFDHVRDKQVGEPMFRVERLKQLALFDPQDRAARNRSGSRQAERLIGSDAALAQEIAAAEQGDGCFLSLFRDHAEPRPSLLNVEDGVRWLSLRKDGLFRAIVVKGPADARIG